MPLGRPTKYNKELQKKADKYLTAYEDEGDVIPSQAGLADYLGIALSTVKDWGNQEDKPDFSATLSKIDAKQHRVGLNKGLSGEFNAAITKLVLHNHGYSDKTESTNKNIHILSELSDEEILEELRRLEDEC